MATLELVNVVKKFGDFTAVDDFNLRVEEGEFVTLSDWSFEICLH